MDVFAGKLVVIIIGSEYEDQIVAALRDLGASGYTTTPARGRGLHAPRTRFWDGINTRFEVIASPRLAERILAHLGKILLVTDLTAYAMPIEAIPPDHFR